MPNVIIIAGPNGAGKSTAAPFLLNNSLSVKHFVNADAIAIGLSAYAPEKVAIQAGRAMLKQMHFLAEKEEDFAFETTLASRTFAPWIKNLKNKSYRFHLLFLMLDDPDLAVSRVKERVKVGGHSVPEETIRRRFKSGLKNFFGLYKNLADSWKLYDNSDNNKLMQIAYKMNNAIKIYNENVWQSLREEYCDK